jgi:hypothetical protein
MSFRRKVWAWDIPMSDYVVLEMPKDAKLLYFGNQNNLARLWALIDPDEEKPKEKRVFRLTGTDHDIHEDVEKLNYIGTFVGFGIKFVLHLFEIVNVTPEEISKYEKFDREDIDDDGGMLLE